MTNEINRMTEVFLNTELKPYINLTREEKHILLDAALDGNCECFVGLIEDWCDVEGCVGSFGSHTVYRTKPKEYKKLDIPWQFIKPAFKYAAMDGCGSVWLYEKMPEWGGDLWTSQEDYWNMWGMPIDTTDVIAEHSLTERPEGV